MDADGNFVVASDSADQGGTSYGVFARSFTGGGCYGDPLEVANRYVVAGERLDYVSYGTISAHHVLVEAGADLIFTAPSIALGPETIVEAGSMFKAGL